MRVLVVDMCIGICIGMCMGMRIGMCTGMYRKKKCDASMEMEASHRHIKTCAETCV